MHLRAVGSKTICSPLTAQGSYVNTVLVCYLRDLLVLHPISYNTSTRSSSGYPLTSQLQLLPSCRDRRAHLSTCTKASRTAVAITPDMQAKAARIASTLQKLYPDPPIPLDHGSPFQLLVAVMLSAQSTDKKVNEITPALFKLAPDAAAMAALEVTKIQELIRAIGLAPTKAKNISAMSKLLLERHSGQVPGSFQELEDLPGVGHKTASVVMTQAFGLPSFPVDTHIHRLAQRWGLTNGRNVEQTEQDLKALFPEQQWRDLHLQIIYFGREHCPAKAHDPTGCPVCSWAAVPPYDRPGASPLKPGQSLGKQRAVSMPTLDGGPADDVLLPLQPSQKQQQQTQGDDTVRMKRSRSAPAATENPPATTKRKPAVTQRGKKAAQKAADQEASAAAPDNSEEPAAPARPRGRQRRG